MLMDLPPAKQENMYRLYWVKIEELTENIPEFVRNYLIYKNRISVKKDDVYPTFKRFVAKEFGNDKKIIAEDLLYFAKIYSFLRQISRHQDDKINTQLERLNKIELTVCYPYLFDVFNDLNQGIINQKIVYQILLVLESYAFRKILVDNTTQGINKMFITFAKEIKKESKWKDNYLEIFKYTLLQKTVSQRFPTDDEFKSTLIYKEIYKLQSKNKNFLLESLENNNTPYSVSVDNLTIEHIMPQKLTKKWKEMLGDNYENIHKKYLHTLGNLSLTANNSKLSNHTLEDKQIIDYQESKLSLNFKLDSIDNWNENLIIERAKRLAGIGLRIWSYPSTTYTKADDEDQLFDLTNQDDFSGTKPVALYLPDGVEISVKSWRNLFANVCKLLHDYSPTQFKQLQNLSEFQWYFNFDKPLRSPIEFLLNKFVEGNVSANTVIAISQKLCEQIDYPLENISFSIASLKKNK